MDTFFRLILYWKKLVLDKVKVLIYTGYLCGYMPPLLILMHLYAL
jgi:hypothetical protein